MCRVMCKTFWTAYTIRPMAMSDQSSALASYVMAAADGKRYVGTLGAVYMTLRAWVWL
jgi:hypothetical protein